MPHKPHMACKKWTDRYNADAVQQAWQHFVLAHRVLRRFNPQVQARDRQSVVAFKPHVYLKRN